MERSFHERVRKPWGFYIDTHAVASIVSYSFFIFILFLRSRENKNTWTRCFIHKRPNDRWNFLPNQRIVFLFVCSKVPRVAVFCLKLLPGKFWVLSWRKSDVSKQALDWKRIAHLSSGHRQAGRQASTYKRVEGEKLEKMREFSEKKKKGEKMSSLLLNDYVDRPAHYQRIFFSEFFRFFSF